MTNSTNKDNSKIRFPILEELRKKMLGDSYFPPRGIDLATERLKVKETAVDETALQEHRKLGASPVGVWIKDINKKKAKARK